MKKILEELMGKSIVSENMELSNLIKDIAPLKEKSFTNLEIEAIKEQEFSLVIYKRENILLRFFKNVKLCIEKIKIMKHSKQFDLKKQYNTNEIN